MSGEWLDHHGRAVNDSHAEVLARRAFVAHLLVRLACLVDALDAAHTEAAQTGSTASAGACSEAQSSSSASASASAAGAGAGAGAAGTTGGVVSDSAVRDSVSDADRQGATSAAAAGAGAAEVEMADAAKSEREAANGASARVQQLLDDSWFEPVPHAQQPQFRLKRDVRVHLYVSSTPCGDARVFCTGPGELDLVEADEAPVSLPLGLETDQHSLRKSRGEHSHAFSAHDLCSLSCCFSLWPTGYTSRWPGREWLSSCAQIPLRPQEIF